MTTFLPVHQDLAEYIGAHVTGLTYSEVAGSNVFVDEMAASPDHAVCVYATGGPESDTLNHFDTPSVQILIRGDANPRWALATWAAIYSAIHGLRSVTLPSGRWLVSCIGVQSGPSRLGPDATGRYRYTANFRLEVENVTTARP